jgi:phosphate starvation-inducible protein PhoH
MPLPKSAELFYNIKLTNEQKEYADAIFDKNVVFVNARSGSGKTTVAVGCAKITGKTLHYVFPTVEEGALGFSRGSVQEKEAKYITPLLDALEAIGESPSKAIYNEDDMQQLKQGTAWVKAYSHNYMRGSNIKDSVIIIDESQNLTKKELKRILTRIHDSCTVIVIGDSNQCDLKNPKDSGFMAYLDHYSITDFTSVCELTINFRGKISSHAEVLV